ncbi:DUF411 domain-containing protein [Wenzhouxiangella sp. AB-CW3]|uniref:DUF411 domain-containing protein n=1 Tax=Wenzhouxiangella sp. AB-CW3 TaxID=2771012 RepID=UPI001CC27867|nr:DUF411 domain-containing protein [Wenzhouxiangella sp. AB-CW3]
MTNYSNIRTTAIVLLIALVTACSPSNNEAQTSAQEVNENAGNGGVETIEETMVVYMTPWCGCCKVWADQSEEAGFEVEIREVEALHPVKEELGVPTAMGSCHTAKIADYFVEGHVPFDDIKRLLDERPDARGLTVPGMPIGSPGMEQGDYRQAYNVYLVGHDGETEVYNHYPEIR